MALRGASEEIIGRAAERRQGSGSVTPRRKAGLGSNSEVCEGVIQQQGTELESKSSKGPRRRVEMVKAASTQHLPALVRSHSETALVQLEVEQIFQPGEL